MCFRNCQIASPHASERSTGLFQIRRRPSLASRQIVASFARGRGASLAWGAMPLSIHADEKNAIASSRIANGAVSQ